MQRRNVRGVIVLHVVKIRQVTNCMKPHRLLLYKTVEAVDYYGVDILHMEWRWDVEFIEAYAYTSRLLPYYQLGATGETKQYISLHLAAMD